jgi:DNA-binding GntR family transcriptional regulator
MMPGVSASKPAGAGRRGYRDVAHVLRERISQGAINGRLPPEVELVAEFGVARDTVRRALALLVDEGLVQTTHGKGHFVAGASTSEGAKPRYVLVADAIEARVRSAQLAAGAAYPSEADLQAEFDVSRTTARRAFAELEARGLVDREPGRRYVAEL